MTMTPTPFRRVKIVATIGPSSSGVEVLAPLLEAGVNLVRLNLSHGDHNQHRSVVRSVRALAAARGRFVAVLADLMGPRFRLGTLASGPRLLARGAMVSFGASGERVDLPVEDPDFLAHLEIGERILIGDGLVELAVRERDGDHFLAQVLSPGTVATRKGINLPDTDLPFTISEKDRDDIAFAVAAGVDYLGVSFVGGPEDLEQVRKEVAAAGGSLPVVAKLERAAVLARLSATVAAADAVMVARGDLGVELPIHRVPVLQKRIVAIGRELGTPVIVATQMLESMIENPRPTRAEATDVANAVFDGADALMLSGETAIGRHPVAAVTTMAEIVRDAEAATESGLGTAREAVLVSAGRGPADRPLSPGAIESMHFAPGGDTPIEVPDAIAAAAVFATTRLGLRYVVAFTQSGFTARMIARYRPPIPILVFTDDAITARRVQLVWGVLPILIERQALTHAAVVREVERELRARGMAQSGDIIALLMSEPIGTQSLTNLLRLHRLCALPACQQPDAMPAVDATDPGR